MAYIVILPRQSLQMTEGTIERWLKAEGCLLYTSRCV